MTALVSDVTAGSRRLDHRPDIQGLRGVAVLAVIAYHVGAPWAAVGFTGVDVFFVLSGYLITRLLLDEFDRTGRIGLGDFIARRVRRLLPMSALVVVVSMLALWVTAGPVRRGAEQLTSLGAALFSANIALAVEGSDYLTADREPVLQHYWSLGVEEQFYLVWPLTLLGLLVGLRRLPRGTRTAALVGAMLVVSLASLALARAWDGVQQPLAFHLLPARAWQLLLGAVVATVELGGWVPSRRRALRVAGATLLIATAAGPGLGATFPWPLALLPTLGTAALVAGGVRAEEHPPAVTGRTLTWIGDRSYGLYLWHWPPLVLLGLTDTDWTDRPVVRLGVVAGSVAVSAATYSSVEQGLRNGPVLATRRRAAVFGVVATAVAVVTVLVVTGWPSGSDGPGGGPVATGTDDETADPGPDAGADAPVASAPDGGRPSEEDQGGADDPAGDPTDAGGTGDPVGDGTAELFDPVAAVGPVPEVLTAGTRAGLQEVVDTLPAIYADGCHVPFRATEPLPSSDCTYGPPGGGTRVALVGDSHAAHWFPALDAAARERSWSVVSLTKSGCSLYLVDVTFEGNRPYPQCAEWQAAVRAVIAEERFDVVVVSGVAIPQHRRDAAEWRQGTEAGLELLREAAGDAPLVALLDPPYVRGGRDVPVCLDEEETVAACTIDRDDDFDDVQRAALATADVVVDTPAVTCGPETCPAVYGGVVVYRDDDHFSVAFAAELAPVVAAAVDSALADGPP